MISPRNSRCIVFCILIWFDHESTIWPKEADARFAPNGNHAECTEHSGTGSPGPGGGAHRRDKSPALPPGNPSSPGPMGRMHGAGSTRSPCGMGRLYSGDQEREERDEG